MKTVYDRRVYWVALNLVLSDTLRPAQKILDYFGSPENACRAPAHGLESLGLEKDRALRLAFPGLLDEAARVLAAAEKKRLAPAHARRRVLSPAPPRDLRPAACPVCRRRSGDPVRARRRRRRGPPADSLRPGGRRAAGRGPGVPGGGRRERPGGRGIDSPAHWGALEGGRTVAVLGSGLDEFIRRRTRGFSGRSPRRAPWSPNSRRTPGRWAITSRSATGSSAA